MKKILKYLLFICLAVFSFSLEAESEPEESLRPSLFKKTGRSALDFNEFSKALFQKMEILEQSVANNINDNIIIQKAAIEDLENFIRVTEQSGDDLFEDSPNKAETLEKYQKFKSNVAILKSEVDVLKPLAPKESNEIDFAIQNSSSIREIENQYFNKEKETLKIVNGYAPILILSTTPVSITSGKLGFCDGFWEAFWEYDLTENIKFVVNFRPTLSYCDPCQGIKLDFATLYTACSECHQHLKERVIFNTICVGYKNKQISELFRVEGEYSNNNQGINHNIPDKKPVYQNVLTLTNVGQCKGKWSFERILLNKFQFKFISENINCDPLDGVRLDFNILLAKCGDYCKNYNPLDILFVVGDNFYTYPHLNENSEIKLGDCMGVFVRLLNTFIHVFDPRDKNCIVIKSDLPTFSLIYLFCGKPCERIQKSHIQYLELIIDGKEFKYIEQKVPPQNKLSRLGNCNGFWSKTEETYQGNTIFKFNGINCFSDPCKDNTFNDFYLSCDNECDGIPVRNILFGSFCPYHNSLNLKTYSKYDSKKPIITMNRFGACHGKWSIMDFVTKKTIFVFTAQNKEICDPVNEEIVEFSYLKTMCGQYCQDRDIADYFFNWSGESGFLIGSGNIKYGGCNGLWRSSPQLFKWTVFDANCVMKLDEVPSYEIVAKLCEYCGADIYNSKTVFDFGTHKLTNILKWKKRTNEPIEKVGDCEGFFTFEKKDGFTFIYFHKLNIYCDTCKTTKMHFNDLVRNFPYISSSDNHEKLVFSPICYAHQYPSKQLEELRYDPTNPIIDDSRLGNCMGSWIAKRIKTGHLLVRFNVTDISCKLNIDIEFSNFYSACGDKCKTIDPSEIIVFDGSKYYADRFKCPEKRSECFGKILKFPYKLKLMSEDNAYLLREIAQRTHNEGYFFDILLALFPIENLNYHGEPPFFYLSPSMTTVTNPKKRFFPFNPIPLEWVPKTIFNGCEGRWYIHYDEQSKKYYPYFVKTEIWCDICQIDLDMSYNNFYLGCHLCWDIEPNKVEFLQKYLCLSSDNFYGIGYNGIPPDIDSKFPKLGTCRGTWEIASVFSKITTYKYTELFTNPPDCDACLTELTYNSIFEKHEILKDKDVGTVELTVKCKDKRVLTLKYDPNNPPAPIRIAREKISVASGAAMQGLLDSMPPEFCWKKGGDVGFIPTLCPPNYFRSLALCYEYCIPGYKMTLGVCWETCRPECTNWGLFCSCSRKHGGDYWRGSYITSQLSNFNSRIPCGGEPGQYYKGGALCYRDCEASLGLINCGIGACSNGQGGCFSTILTMVVEIIVTIAQAVITVVTFGGAATASQGFNNLKKAVVDMGKAGLKGAYQSARQSLKTIWNTSFKKLVKQVAKKAKKFIGESMKGQLQDIYLEGVIEQVTTSIYNDVNSKEEPNDMQNSGVESLKMLDFTNIANTVEACQNIHKTGALNCAKNAMGVVSLFDPTGLVGLATAFMHPHCDGV